MPKYWHISGPKNRPSILEHGLNWELSDPETRLPNDDDPENHPEGWPRGQYLFTDPEQADLSSEDDIWEVDDTGLNIQPDPYLGMDNSHAVYVKEPIPPQNLKLVRAAPWDFENNRWLSDGDDKDDSWKFASEEDDVWNITNGDEVIQGRPLDDGEDPHLFQYVPPKYDYSMDEALTDLRDGGYHWRIEQGDEPQMWRFQHKREPFWHDVSSRDLQLKGYQVWYGDGHLPRAKPHSYTPSGYFLHDPMSGKPTERFWPTMRVDDQENWVQPEPGTLNEPYAKEHYPDLWQKHWGAADPPDWKEKYNYREAEGSKSCASCSAWRAGPNAEGNGRGKCLMFDARADADMTCDEWSKTWKESTVDDGSSTWFNKESNDDQAEQEDGGAGAEAQEAVGAPAGQVEYYWPSPEEAEELSYHAVDNHQGFRDPGGFASAVANARYQQIYGGVNDIYTLAAHLINYVQRQQALVEGNKRTATLLGLWFLEENGVDTEGIPPEEFGDLVVAMAEKAVTPEYVGEYLRKVLSQRTAGEFQRQTDVEQGPIYGRFSYLVGPNGEIIPGYPGEHHDTVYARHTNSPLPEGDEYLGWMGLDHPFYDYGQGDLNIYYDPMTGKLERRNSEVEWNGHPVDDDEVWEAHRPIWEDLVSRLDDPSAWDDRGFYEMPSVPKVGAVEPLSFEHYARFILQADWNDVMAKAKRLIQEGKVTILHNTPAHVMAQVIGDGTDNDGEPDMHEVEFSREDPNSNVITQSVCDCAYNQYRWDRTRPWKKFEGRPCSHILAAYWKSKATPQDIEDQAPGYQVPVGQKGPAAPQGQQKIPGVEPGVTKKDLGFGPGAFTPEGQEGAQVTPPVPSTQQIGIPGQPQNPFAPPKANPPAPQKNPTPQREQLQLFNLSPEPSTTPPNPAVSVPGATPPTPENPIQLPGTFSSVLAAADDEMLQHFLAQQANGDPIYVATTKPQTLEFRGGKHPMPGAQPYNVSSEGVPLYKVMELGYNPETGQRENADVNALSGAPEWRGQYGEVPANRRGEVRDFDPHLGWAYVHVPLHYPGGEDARLHPHSLAGWMPMNELRVVHPPRTPFRRRR